MRSKSNAVNLSQPLTLDNRTFFGLFTAREFADQSLGDMLRWAEYGARLYKWSLQNFEKPVLETDETMPEPEELVEKIEEKTEESVDKIEEKTEESVDKFEEKTEESVETTEDKIEEERLSPDLIAAIERAEKAYAEKEATKETMPIAVPFAQFPYKRTYCGIEMEYLAPRPSPKPTQENLPPDDEEGSPKPTHLPPDDEGMEVSPNPTQESPSSDDKENVAPSKKPRRA